MSHHPFKREERKSNNEGAIDGGWRCLEFFFCRGGVNLKGTESSFGVRLSAERCRKRWRKVDLKNAPRQTGYNLELICCGGNIRGAKHHD
jgi:hypothetical protein